MKINTVRNEIVNEYSLTAVEDPRNEKLIKELNRIGNPHHVENVVHVTGTNGSSSTSHFIGEVLMKQGRDVGIFSNLIVVDRFRKFFGVNDEIPSEEELWELAEYVNQNTEITDEWSFIFTMAMVHFNRHNVDIIVCEAGIGGEKATTNVLTNDGVAITNIGLDHTDILGNTKVEIARSKAGLFEEGAIGVANTPNKQTYSVIEEYANEVNAECYPADTPITFSRSQDSLTFIATYRGESVETRITVPYLFENINTAVTLLEKSHFTIQPEAVRSVLSTFYLPGRGEVFDGEPRTIGWSVKPTRDACIIRVS